MFKQKNSGEEDTLEDGFFKHEVGGRRAVFAAGLQGNGSQKWTECFFMPIGIARYGGLSARGADRPAATSASQSSCERPPATSAPPREPRHAHALILILILLLLLLIVITMLILKIMILVILMARVGAHWVHPRRHES